MDPSLLERQAFSSPPWSLISPAARPQVTNHELKIKSVDNTGWKGLDNVSLKVQDGSSTSHENQCFLVWKGLSRPVGASGEHVFRITCYIPLRRGNGAGPGPGGGMISPHWSGKPQTDILRTCATASDKCLAVNGWMKNFHLFLRSHESVDIVLV